MSEPEQEQNDYERLVREYATVAGPEDAFGAFIQDGIEMEDFRQTKAGKILIGTALHRARLAIQTILDPNIKYEDLNTAVAELRVQHRVLEQISTAVRKGREAQQQLNSIELGEQENPDEPASDDI